MEGAKYSLAPATDWESLCASQPNSELKILLENFSGTDYLRKSKYQSITMPESLRSGEQEAIPLNPIRNSIQ